MKKYFFILLIPVLVIINCKGSGKDISNKKTLISKVENKTNDSLLIVDSINKKLIGKEIKEIPRDQLLNCYKTSLELDFDRPYMWDVLIIENETLIKYYQYQRFKLNSQEYNSLYISIKYEDATYEGVILFLDDNDITSPNKALLIYENLDSEEKYQRTTKQENNKELIINFFRNGKLYKNQTFTFKRNFFVEYFKKDETINKSWGTVENVSTNNLNGKTKEYSMKGEVSNNVKNGHWEERRYSFEYDKSIWMDGHYTDGIKDGEWNLSPNGAVDKVEIYKEGKIIRSFNP